MATVHISEAEAADDFTGWITRVRAGVEVVIEKEAAPAVVLRLADKPRVRRFSESLRMARERNSKVLLDDEFGNDLEAAIASHPEPIRNPWND